MRDLISVKLAHVVVVGTFLNEVFPITIFLGLFEAQNVKKGRWF